MIVTPIFESLSMFSRCKVEKGVSRTTNKSCPLSFKTTSLARSIKLSDIPCAIAPSEPIEQGQTTICFGALEPDATGENQSSFVHIVSFSVDTFRCVDKSVFAAIK